jgi:hypothetical protein
MEDLRAFGAVIVDDPHAATHLVTSAVTFRRTPKLMIAINIGIPAVVTEEWLTASARAKRPVDPAPYTVRPAEKEREWGFTMPASLAAAQSGRRVLDGCHVYVTSGVCGVKENKVPPADELKAIVESGGGVWVETAAAWKKLVSAAGRAGARAGGQLLLITTEIAMAASAPVSALVAAGVASGRLAGGRAFRPEVLFLAAMRQRLSLTDADGAIGNG